MSNNALAAIIMVCLTVGFTSCSISFRQSALEDQRIQLERENNQLKRDLGLVK